MKYSLTITTEHPIVKGHMVYEENLLPGLAFIDILYQLVQNVMGLDYKKHCLKGLSIYNPLIVRENCPVKLEILFNKISVYWKITVRNAGKDEQGSPLSEKLYITAELHEKTSLFEEQIDIETVKQEATQCVDMETVYVEARKRGLVHRGMIKASGDVYLTDFGCLIEVKVDDAYQDKEPKVLFHPTLIDGAGMATRILEGKGDIGNNEDLYMPVFFESFSCIEPLHTHCYARVNSSLLRMMNDVRTTDIAFFNKTGKQVAQLNGITAKRIRFKEQVNPDLKKETVSSAVYLQRELQEWKRSVAKIDGDEQEFPQHATVSSFGTGGSKEHLIIEEYAPFQEEPSPIPCSLSSPQIVVFSAKNQDELVAVIKQMLDFMELEKNISLSDLAYTLQVGREAMEFRLAMIVSNQEELIRGMKNYFSKKAEVFIPTFIGNVEGNCSKIISLLSGKAEQAILQVFLAEKDFEKIALYWTQGGKISWELLYEGQKFRKIPLPTYPFARERYWISEQGEEHHCLASIQNATDREQKVIIDISKTKQEKIQGYIMQFLSQELHISQDQLKVNKNLQDYGVDLIIIMRLMRDLERRFKIKITGREMLEYQTIISMSVHLALEVETLSKQYIDETNVLQTKSQPMELRASSVDEPEIEALKKFKQGELTLEEIESLLDKGVI